MTTQHFHFLLLPEFSMMGFVSALEPLRVANRFLPGAYQWHMLGVEGSAVKASNGMSLNLDSTLDAAQEVQTLFVVAGFDPLKHYRTPIGAALRRWQRRGATLGAIDTGAFVLAEAGLLGEQRVTLHWEARSAFAERYPGKEVSGELFEIGESCISCAGGTAAIDMMLALIAARHGHGLAAQVSEQFVLGRIRSQSDHQRMEISARYGLHNAKTVQVIRAMEEHLEDPLSAEDLARSIGVTRRQLERLFRTHLKDTPSHFYLCLRLDRARQLLLQTDMSIIDIGVASGFTSPSHFSRAYRARFGASPKDKRKQTARAMHTVHDGHQENSGRST